MDYTKPLHYKWFEFRSRNHLTFVQDTVDSVREFFPMRPIYTHQIPMRDKEITLDHKNRDFASPQWTAFAKNASPGFTVYAYAGDKYGTKRKFVAEVSTKLKGKDWGFLEFNTARAFKGSRSDLKTFTHQFISFAYNHGVRVIAPLAWTSNSLDNAVKDTGVADGIKRFVEEGSLKD